MPKFPLQPYAALGARKRRARLATLELNECPAWHKLDYAYLHRFLLDELLTRNLGTTPTLHYVKSLEDAKRTARQCAGVALLVNATPMAHLRAVAESGGLMPQKSTYFHPKLATGLTMNKLEWIGSSYAACVTPRPGKAARAVE